MRLASLALFFTMLVSPGLVSPGLAFAQVCAGVRCSGHGTCMEERSRAYCFCDEGFSAEGQACVQNGPAHDPDHPPSGMAIVGVALSEEGRDLPHVGTTRRGLPGPLAHFLSPDDLWCSDFVSWVYRAAGIPFTSGYDGGWHLTNNQMIRAWYMRRAMFVAKGSDEWRAVRPLPGDYVRIATSTYGHSAIVRYSTPTTLYTVEGNAGGRVITTHYDNWRTHERLDGIGLTTAGAARMNFLEAEAGVAP